ncbi:hypothetical protein [Myxacorys almedinensis]|uniref:Uncharacterized protein n=1 Tax=Myxacorys almedinensis A TaxID=2690445 RepID=A0A8J8CPH2_9CYAN|nr:hypothetical protein [Myxacorys almedinensis]NDJ19472.1 hypothetical protein [Myxacorys almedinensis A]
MLRQFVISAISLSVISAAASALPSQAQTFAVCPVKPGLQLNRIANGTCYYVKAQPNPAVCPVKPGYVLTRHVSGGSCYYAPQQRVRFVPQQPLGAIQNTIGAGQR